MATWSDGVRELLLSAEAAIEYVLPTFHNGRCTKPPGVSASTLRP